MRVSFVYDVEDEYWNDGLKKAIDLLSNRLDIRKFNGEFTNYFANFILVWGAFGSWQEKKVAESPLRKGICVAGGPIDHPDIHKFDVVFVETKWHQKEFRKRGVNAQLAFGVNEHLFYDMGLKRHIHRLCPGAYAEWKRHFLFAQKEGQKVAVGYMQPDGVEKHCYENHQEDVLTIPRVAPETLAWLYNQSEIVNITSNIDGGGERTVLEALSCGCDVEIEPDNHKLLQLYRDVKGRIPDSGVYANQLMKGIHEVSSRNV